MYKILILLHIIVLNIKINVDTQKLAVFTIHIHVVQAKHGREDSVLEKEVP